MSIQRGENAWRGTHTYDLAEYLESDVRSGKVIQPTCDCGNRGFHVAFNFDAGEVQATCGNCGTHRELGRSAGTTPPQLRRLVCECGANVFELGVTVERAEDGIWMWTSLGFRCPTCGLLGACANRRQTVAFGEPAPLGGFADPDRDRELLKAYPLQLYEVIFWGGAGDPDGYDGRDALYLVAAKDLEDAVLHVEPNQTHLDNRADERPMPDVVQELGNAEVTECYTQIVRGPYFAHAYEFAKRRWYWDSVAQRWIATDGGKKSYMKHFPL